MEREEASVIREDVEADAHTGDSNRGSVLGVVAPTEGGLEGASQQRVEGVKEAMVAVEGGRVVGEDGRDEMDGERVEEGGQKDDVSPQTRGVNSSELAAVSGRDGCGDREGEGEGRREGEGEGAREGRRAEQAPATVGNLLFML